MYGGTIRKSTSYDIEVVLQSRFRVGEWVLAVEEKGGDLLGCAERGVVVWQYIHSSSRYSRIFWVTSCQTQPLSLATVYI